MTINNLNRNPLLGPLTTGPLGAPQPTAPAATGTTPAGVRDGFQLGGTQAPEPTAAQKQWQTALVAYQDKVVSILGASQTGLGLAESAAHGRHPATSGSVTATQQTDLTEATKDLFLSMPVGVLAPDAKAFLQARGLRVDTLDTTALKDLGKTGGDLARQLADKFKDASPAAFYGVAAAAAVAVGVYGYTQGSQKLEKLGIKPDFTAKVFNDQVTIKAKANWDANFTNPNITGGADGRFRVGGNNTHLNVGGAVNASGAGLGSLNVNTADVHVGVDTSIGPRATDVASLTVNGRLRDGTVAPGVTVGVNRTFDVGADRTLNVTSNVELGRGGVTGATTDLALDAGRVDLGVGVTHGEGGRLEGWRASGSYTGDNVTLATNLDFDAQSRLRTGTVRATGTVDNLGGGNLSGSLGATYDAGNGVNRLNGSVEYNRDRLRLSGSVEHNLATSTTTGTAGLGWRPRDNVDLGAHVFADDTGNRGVGVGVRISF